MSAQSNRKQKRDLKAEVARLEERVAFLRMAVQRGSLVHAPALRQREQDLRLLKRRLSIL